MAPNPRRLDARLQSEVYDKIPAIECQGLCHDSCGPVPVTVRERQRMEQATGREFTCGAGASCSMLTPERTCRVYDMRPTLCRLWGVIESLPCHYGCKPERVLTDKEGWELVLRAEQIGGSDRTSRELAEMFVMLQQMPDDVVRRVAAAITPRPQLEARDHALPRTVIQHEPR